MLSCNSARPCVFASCAVWRSTSLSWPLNAELSLAIAFCFSIVNIVSRLDEFVNISTANSCCNRSYSSAPTNISPTLFLLICRMCCPINGRTGIKKKLIASCAMRETSYMKFYFYIVFANRHTLDNFVYNIIGKWV